jgi:hypothetical protein
LINLLICRELNEDDQKNHIRYDKSPFATLPKTACYKKSVVTPCSALKNIYEISPSRYLIDQLLVVTDAYLKH